MWFLLESFLFRFIKVIGGAPMVELTDDQIMVLKFRVPTAEKAKIREYGRRSLLRLAQKSG